MDTNLQKATAPTRVISRRVISIKDIEDALQFSIAQLAELEKLKACQNIVIKPNLCCRKPSQSGATTDVALVRSVVELIREINPLAEISVVESNNFAIKADKAFELHGYNELTNKYPNVKLVNLSKERKYYVEIDGHFLANLLIPKTLLKMDYFISLTTLKTHAFERISGVLKNQFGCITGTYRKKLHPFLSEVLTDLNSVYKPNLCIIDGRIAMEGFGPVDGTPVHIGLLIIGNDPVATDAVAAQMMGFNPESVPHLKYAAKHGFGDIKNIAVSENVSFKLKSVSIIKYMGFRLFLKFLRYIEYLRNMQILVRKTRNASSTVSLSYVWRRLTINFVLKTVKNLIFKRDG